MPRIDPLKLLTCLSVLLAPNGGIKSSQEVKRLAGLMTKFSKKLVSKCIYIQILKCTETELLGQFMTAGGWTLTHMWLTDGILTKNWSLVQELLELLLLCPVDVMRLKSNSAPKLVKSLSRDSAHEGVRLLASKLVEQWLKIVKEESIGTTVATVATVAPTETPKPAPEAASSTVVVVESPSTAAKAVVKKLPAAIKPIVMRRDDPHEDEEDDEEEVDEEEPAENKVVEPLPRQNKGVVVEGDQDSDEMDDEIFNQNQRQRKAQLRSTVVTNNGKRVKQIVRRPQPNNTETLVYKFTVKDPKKVVVAKVDNVVSPPAKKLAVAAPKAKQTIIVDSQNLRTASPEKEPITVPSKIKIPRKSDAVVAGKEGGVDTASDDSSQVLNNNKIVVTKNKKDEAVTAAVTNKSKSSVVTVDDGTKLKQKPAIVGTASKVKEKEKEVEEKDKKVEVEKLSTKEKDRDKDRERKSNSSTSSSSHHNHKTSSSKSSSSKTSTSSSSRRSGKSSSSSGDKERSSKDKERSSKSSSSNSSSSSNRDKDKDKDRDKKKSSSSDKELTSSLSDQKIADSESVSKIGKIPRKPSKDESSDSTKMKKPSISIERRQGDKPKTVKTLNSQFRSHGLTEEAPPPPARKGLKKPSSTPTPGAAIPSLKRTSPDKDKDAPPEKKLKEDILAKSPEEKPGAIKLIKAKPQLMESDMFMDALSAASSKKDVRKRKRQLSKDDGPTTGAGTVAGKTTSGKKSPPHEGAATTPTSPKVMAAPMKFYQDTLETSENDAGATAKAADETSGTSNGKKDASATNSSDDKSEDDKDKDEEDPAIDIQIDDLEKLESMKMTIDEVIEEKKGPGPGCGPDGPPGVLVIHRRKGAKKQVKWKTDDMLVEIEYFVLDETERVNVTKNFVDARSSERLDERNAMQNRKLPSEDLMEERMPWQPLIIVDNVPPLPEGSGSQEKKIQFERESRVLQSLYFSRSLVPDSAAEPDMETHPKTDPAVIPLDDVTGNPDAVNDFTNMAWPEPKGMAPAHQHNNNYQTNQGFAEPPSQQPGFPNPYDQQPQANWMGQPPMNNMAPMGVPDPFHNPMMMVQPTNQPFNPQFQPMGGAPPANFHPQNFQPPPNMMPMGMNGPPPMHMNQMGPGPMRGANRNDQDGGGRGGWFRGGGGGGGGGGGWNNNNNNRDHGRNDRNDWTRGNGAHNDRRNDRDYRERGVCRAFQNTGFCRMGAKCNYIHVNDTRGHSRGGRY